MRRATYAATLPAVFPCHAPPPPAYRPSPTLAYSPRTFPPPPPTARHATTISIGLPGEADTLSLDRRADAADEDGRATR